MHATLYNHNFNNFLNFLTLSQPRRYYRKRGSAFYIVREVREVRERERERESETEVMSPK